MDETELFRKQMPASIYTSNETQSIAGFKSFKDKIILLLGGNIAVFKLKLFLIFSL